MLKILHIALSGIEVTPSANSCFTHYKEKLFAEGVIYI